jgi:flagellar FliL protein
MAKDEKAAEAAPKKKSKQMLIIIVAAVVLLGGGAGGYFAFFAGPSQKPAPKPGKVVALEAITLNLAEGHFLKLKLSLQATTTAAAADPDGSKALDIAISEFSNRPLAELASNAARDKAKAELRKKINKAYEGHVMDVYFTEFVMQ